MNPWDLVAWVGAVCVTALIIAITATVITGLIKGPKRDKSRRIL